VVLTNGAQSNGHTNEYSREDWNDIQHTGPGTLAGRYMRMFWHPVAVADDLPAGETKPIRIMSENFTLYRGEGGTPHVLDFRCAHQGTQLSLGWVEEDSIRCFFHGWVFDQTGQCVEQPGEPERPFCEKIRIRSYPTEEYLGLVFAYLGEGEPPPLPRYPDFEEEGILDVQYYERECNYAQDFEPKPIHGAFVHSDGPPFRRKSIPISVKAEETEWGFTTFAVHENGQVKAKPYGMPNVHHVKAPPDQWGSGWTDSLVHIVPIDDEHMRSFSVELTRLTGEAATAYLERRGGVNRGVRKFDHEVVKLILAGKLKLKDVDPDSIDMTWLEDDIAYVGQGAISDRSKEHLGPSDAGNICMRSIWARELRALAEGRPLIQWRRTVGAAGVVATDGVR